jgi:hypothetical protein
MTTDFHVLFGLLAVVVGIIGYIPYYRDIFRGTTKPHPFTWIGFGLLNGITFIAQIVTGAGPGAWVSALTTFATIGIAALAFRNGEKRITRFDWICLVGALLGIALWRLTSDPLGAVLVVTAADLLSFAPTFRKAYLRPHEETTSVYAVGVLKYGISLAALTTVNLTTTIFPVSICVTSAAMVILILVRRAQNL